MNTVNLSQQPPAAYSPRVMDAALNNGLAWAYASGDPRMTIKQYDRPGLSRGAAQRNQGGIDSANNLANGLADAYSNDIKNRTYSANVALQGQQGQEQFGQALAGLQEQNNYASQMAALQRQQSKLGLLGGLTQGLFN